MSDGYYDRQGNPITIDQFCKMREADREIIRVAYEDDVCGSAVSTVWLGSNHNYGDGDPIIFETLVMGGDLDGEMWRYHTEEQAKAGHERVVAMIEHFDAEAKATWGRTYKEHIAAISAVRDGILDNLRETYEAQ